MIKISHGAQLEGGEEDDKVQVRSILRNSQDTIDASKHSQGKQQDKLNPALSV
jgi:ribosome recycling factor